VIVRIVSEGQYRLSDEQVGRLQKLDDGLIAAATDADATAMHNTLNQIVGFVRSEGQALALDDLSSSDVILPSPDATPDEIRDLMREDGLIPG